MAIFKKAVAERKKQDSLKSTSGTAPATKFKLAPAWNSAFNPLSPEEEQACNNLFGIFKDISASLKKSSPGDIAVVTRLTSEYTASRALGALVLLEAEADIQISALGEIKAFKKVMEGRTAEFDNAKSAFMA